MQKLIEITSAQPLRPALRFATPVSLVLNEGCSIAILGENGAGKSLLAGMLTGAIALDRPAQYNLGDAPREGKIATGALTNKAAAQDIVHLDFKDAYGSVQPAYYQQRWNRGDEQVFPTVEDVLQRISAAEANAGNEGTQAQSALLHEIGIDALRQQPINCLSSGELRRFQLAKALLRNPRVLVLDNPYIGLDPHTRGVLSALLERISQRITLVVTAARAEDVPPCIQIIIPIRQRCVGNPVARDLFIRTAAAARANNAAEITLPKAVGEPYNGEDIALMRNVTVGYDGRTILKDLTWHVRRGERWAVEGPNGAGKSTLLSLLCADNPAAYALHIQLFSRQRGTGESIWDIKRRIGYTSPELFYTLRQPRPAIDIVASGLLDTVGLFARIRPEQRDACRAWMQAFGASHLSDRTYTELSSGEQRLVLLVRAFVKQPDLLVLDEPFHGLDTPTRLRAQAVIEKYLARTDRTLVMVTHYRDELPACITHHLTLQKH